MVDLFRCPNLLTHCAFARRKDETKSRIVESIVPGVHIDDDDTNLEKFAHNLELVFSPIPSFVMSARGITAVIFATQPRVHDCCRAGTSLSHRVGNLIADFPLPVLIVVSGSAQGRFFSITFVLGGEGVVATPECRQDGKDPASSRSPDE